ncbi:MAG: cytidine deaminase [Candidatus Melainabacteria bacterium]|nr:cytidine deaminase [Candidatus Melainabacteria bacterium]
MTNKELIELARSASDKTYSPYSHFPVGSAVLTVEGRVFTGCNIENASYGGTICAERTAFVKAVSEGYRKFQTVAVVAAKAYECWPCGLCRQFMSEFGVELDVVVEQSGGSLQSMKLKELLPCRFGPDHLAK